MDTIRTELLSKAAAKRFIKNEASRRNLDEFKFDAFFTDNSNNPDDYSAELIRTKYAEITDIDNKINIGKIENVEGAKRMRKIKLSNLKNIMVKWYIVDYNILKKENIAKRELLKMYYEHYTSSGFIGDVLSKYPFIQKEFHRLAELGELSSSKNHREIKELKEELREMKGGLLKTMRLNYMIKELEINDDFSVKYFPMENLLFIIKYKNRTKKNCFNPVQDFGMVKHYNYSPTFHDRIIGLIVKLYKAEHRDEIVRYKTEKNRLRKNTKRNVKKTTAKEKRDIVQNLKKQGLTYSEALKQVNFSVKTFQRNWILI